MDFTGAKLRKISLEKEDLSLSSTGTEEGRVQSADRHRSLAFSSLHCEPAHVGISLAMTEEREKELLKLISQTQCDRLMQESCSQVRERRPLAKGPSAVLVCLVSCLPSLPQSFSKIPELKLPRNRGGDHMVKYLKQARI